MMNPQQFIAFLNKNFEENKDYAGWLATETNGVVFIFDEANRFVASVSFYRDQPCFEFAKSGEKYKEIILAMWQKYLADQEDNDIHTQQDNTMARVTILVVIVTMVACALVAFGGLYLGSLLFN